MKIINYSEFSNADLLNIAKETALGIRNSLPKELHEASFTLESRLPWKATMFRELLLHRFSDFVDSTIELYEAQRIIPAFVLTRAVMENTAVMFWFSTKITEFSKNRDEHAFGDFLMKGMFGARDEGFPQRAYNILTAVDYIDKHFKGTREVYDRFSEFTHPNYFGVMGSYSNLDKENYVIHLGKEHPQLPVEIGLVPLVVCLEVFIDYYNSAGNTLKSINEFYEHSKK